MVQAKGTDTAMATVTEANMVMAVTAMVILRTNQATENQGKSTRKEFDFYLYWDLRALKSANLFLQI